MTKRSAVSRKNETLAKHKFEMVVFDLDGVLADTTECHVRAFQDLWAEIGIEGPAYDLIAGRRTSDVVAQIMADRQPSTEQINAWVFRKQSQARHYLSTVPIVYDDAVPCLAALNRVGLPLALATGASPETAQLILSRLGAGCVSHRGNCQGCELGQAVAGNLPARDETSWGSTRTDVGDRRQPGRNRFWHRFGGLRGLRSYRKSSRSSPVCGEFFQYSRCPGIPRSTSLMKRLLIIPAAGKGTRLETSTPKVLCPVNGRAMIDYLLGLYQTSVEHFILVVSPENAGAVRAHCQADSRSIEFDVQAKPTGMLDAILTPLERVRQLQPDRVWITWCDQIAIEGQTINRLRCCHESHPTAAAVFPTMIQAVPYIHFVRDEGGRIVAVRQRREGDMMPARDGESDMGLFSLSRQAYCDELPRFRDQAVPGTKTGERNFLPFLPWVGRQFSLETFPGCHELESVGINTPEDLVRVEQHFQRSGRH